MSLNERTPLSSWRSFLNTRPCGPVSSEMTELLVSSLGTILSKAKEQKRERTAQHTYTALEALLCARLISQRVDSEQIGTSTVLDRTDRYLFAINDLVAFYAQIGRVCDAFDSLSDLWSDPRLHAPLDEYYQQRNTVLHEVKIPFKFEGNLLSIIEPQGAEHDGMRWGSGLSWSQAKEMPLAAVPDLLTRVFGEVSKMSNDAFARLHSVHMSKAFPTLPSIIREFEYERLRGTTSASMMMIMDYHISEGHLGHRGSKRKQGKR